MKIKDLRQKSDKELQALLMEEREKSRRLKFGLKSKSLKKSHEIRETKRNIAQILTVLKELK